MKCYSFTSNYENDHGNGQRNALITNDDMTWLRCHFDQEYFVHLVLIFVWSCHLCMKFRSFHTHYFTQTHAHDPLTRTCLPARRTCYLPVPTLVPTTIFALLIRRLTFLPTDFLSSFLAYYDMYTYSQCCSIFIPKIKRLLILSYLILFFKKKLFFVIRRRMQVKKTRETNPYLYYS